MKVVRDYQSGERGENQSLGRQQELPRKTVKEQDILPWGRQECECCLLQDECVESGPVGISLHTLRLLFEKALCVCVHALNEAMAWVRWGSCCAGPGR